MLYNSTQKYILDVLWFFVCFLFVCTSFSNQTSNQEKQYTKMKNKSLLSQLIIIILCMLTCLLYATEINNLHAHKYRDKSAIHQHRKHTRNRLAEHDKDDTIDTPYKVGFGIGDITGPAAEINMVCIIDYLYQ